MAKKIIIDEEACIGCNTCPLMDPQTFELDPNTYKAKVKNQPTTISDTTQTAINSCPVAAITIEENQN